MAKPKKKYSNLLKHEIKFIKEKFHITKIADIDTAILKDLKERLKKLKDTRNKNMLIYKMWDVVMCVIIASFANNDTWDDIYDFVVDNYDFFKSFLQMTGGIPKKESYERIIGLIDKDELNNILLEFFQEITFKTSVEEKVFNIDGKVNNGSKRNKTTNSETKSPLNCLNVFSNEYRYCIITKMISDKSNEIPAVEEIIKGLDLTDITVTWDALNTQTKNVEAVINSKGDYVVPIKGNQGQFYQDLIDYFDDDRCDEIKAGNTNSDYYTYLEKSHSAVIKYECFNTSDISWYDRLSEWAGIKSIALIKKTITKKEKVKNTRKNAKKEDIYKEVTTVEKRYYITSKKVNAKVIEEIIRGHWSVENKIHFHLDFTFCQDKNKTTNKNALINLEVIHKFVLACLERVKPKYEKKSLKSIRKHLTNNFEQFLPEFLCYLALS